MNTKFEAIATKIISQAELDSENAAQFKALIMTTLQEYLSDCVVAGTSPGASPTADGRIQVVKKAGGINGYTLFSSEKRKQLNAEMGLEAAKAYFIKEGGVTEYIPKLWALLTPAEQEVYNTRATTMRATGVTTSTAVGGERVNYWHQFQSAYPAYLARQGKTVSFQTLATETGEKYQEMKAQGTAVLQAFIAANPPLPKVKKSKAKKSAAAAAAPVSI